MRFCMLLPLKSFYVDILKVLRLLLGATILDRISEVPADSELSLNWIEFPFAKPNTQRR